MPERGNEAAILRSRKGSFIYTVDAVSTKFQPEILPDRIQAVYTTNVVRTDASGSPAAA